MHYQNYHTYNKVKWEIRENLKRGKGVFVNATGGGSVFYDGLPTPFIMHYSNVCISDIVW